jgi:hypothetical protein
MDVPGAIIVLSQLEKVDRETIPITPEEALKAKLPVFHVLRDGKTQAVISCQVNKKDYMEYLRSTFKLVRKGSNIVQQLHNQSTG